MTDGDDPPKRPPFPFDFNFNGKDFNEFLKELQNIIENIAKDADIGSLFGDDPSSNPFVWGFSFGQGPDGTPRFEKFGDLFKNLGTVRPPVEPEDQTGDRVREPLVDVIEEGDRILVIVELPGVEKDQIKLKTTEDKLRLKARTDKRLYKKVVRLPSAVDPLSAKAQFQNGVLEVALTRLV